MVRTLKALSYRWVKGYWLRRSNTQHNDGMPLAIYKDLCIDANDPATMAAFWGHALQLRVEHLPDGDARLVGERPQQTVWLNRVPEPTTVKQRTHLDVFTAEVADLVVVGGQVLDGASFDWTVLADPEGGELCAFVRDDRLGLYEISVDCVAHQTQSAWWADVLGATVRDDGRGFSWLEDVEGAPFEALVFCDVPEPKTVKNRIHLDFVVPDLDALVAAGATVLRPRDDEIGWTVMADPEGNEFCAFTP